MANGLLNRIQSVSKQAPTLNREAARRAREAKEIEFRRGLGQAPTQASTTRAAQQIGAQTTQALGRPLVAAQQQTREQQAGLKRMETAERGRQAQQQLFERGQAQQAQLQSEELQQRAEQQAEAQRTEAQLTEEEIDRKQRLQQMGMDYDNSLAFMSRKQREDLADLSRTAKSEIFDARLTFEQDELGRKFSNARQLADYAVATAESEEQLRDRMQEIEQQSRKASIMYDEAAKRIAQLARQDFKTLNAERERVLKERLYEIEQRLRNKKANMNRQAANSQAIVGAGVSIAKAFI